MLACNSINSTIDVFTLALLLILFIATVIKKGKGARERMLLIVLALHAANALGDLVSWRLASESGALVLACTTAANFLTYLAGPLAYTGLCALAFGEITRRDKAQSGAGRALLLAIGVLGLANTSLALINIPTGILYTLDASNSFEWGPLRTLPDNLALLQLVLLLPAVLAERGGSARTILPRYLVYAGAPIVAIAMENLFPTLMLLIPAVAIVLLLAYVNEQHEQERLLLQKELEISENRMSLLMGQIEPHFVSNALVAIQQLCVQDPPTAQRATQDLARYLRANFEALDNGNPIPLARELEHVRCYVDLEQADPACKVRMEYQLDDSDFRVPPLSVQPLVENAFRHGASRNADGGTVTVHAYRKPGLCVVEVVDDGPGFDEGALPDAGVGLRNVRRRVELQCAGTLQVEGSGKGTRVTMALPCGDGDRAAGGEAASGKSGRCA